MIAVNSLRRPWKKRLQERSERTHLKLLEKELRDVAVKEKEVLSLCQSINQCSYTYSIFFIKHPGVYLLTMFFDPALLRGWC